MKVLVTGGAGFIGSAVCRLFVGELKATVLNVDKLTYAANLSSLRAVESSPRYAFRQADICDRQAIGALLREFDPDVVLHLAAESHVDRSTVRPTSSRPTSRGPACCSRPHWPIGRSFRRSAQRYSAFIMSRPTRFSARSGLTAASPKPRDINRTRPIRLRRLPPITWCAPGGRPLGSPL